MINQATIEDYRAEYVLLWRLAGILYSFARSVDSIVQQKDVLVKSREFIMENFDVEEAFIVAATHEGNWLVCTREGVQTVSELPFSPNLAFDGKSKAVTDASELKNDPFLSVLNMEITNVVSVPLQVQEGAKREFLGILGIVRSGPSFSIEDQALLITVAELISLATKTAILFETELKLHKQLAQYEKLAAMGQFAAGVAHEINNPLAVMSGEAQYLLGKVEKGSSIHESLEAIKRNADRAKTIVENLLTFARQKEPEVIPVDVNEVVEETLLLVEKQVSLDNVKVLRRFGDVPRVMADRNQLIQVFLNILRNACDAMPDGGEITIVTDVLPKEGFVSIAFSDTGVGIPKDKIGQLFEPFCTSKPVGKGTGLGLAVSHGIIKKHGGNIEVESVVGVGSTFTVKLPVGRGNTK